ncbi:centrosome-associated protein CEP250-like [Haliotis rufescens]|uniref:centrosome-associated protein CEP250-like n=1 Tax=Haliotis rufescens TaxID=6454 RepID=UPI00201EF036|nr:centrosome-associated protein CEP250-like [Haliotis rufescens]XP_046356014.2 centrosome-associated protein CEP250-like [Haliotis rufescens]
MFGDDSDVFSESIVEREGPHHSTPIKDGPFKRPLRPVRITARVEPSSPVRHVVSDGQHSERPGDPDRSQHQHYLDSGKQRSPVSLHSPRQNPMSSSDSTTQQKQRREIQLLIQELRERDNELNETVTAHSNQLLAWERDRQRLLTLEQKCSRYEGELQHKKKQVDMMKSKLKAARSYQETHNASLSTTQEQLEQLSRQKQHSVVHMDTLEKQNESLGNSVKAMSGTIGQLEAREQELMTLLHLKEKDVSQATNSVAELNSRIQLLDMRCKECQTREADALHRATQWKQKYTQAREEMEALASSAQSKDNELSLVRSEMQQLQQRLVAAGEELLMTGEREKSKDDLIESLRSKQERTLAELRSVRELYERQQREMTLMQLNLDSSRENSNQNSNMEQSIGLDDSISCHGNEPVQCVSPRQQEIDNDHRRVSFEDRLSSFLDQDTDSEAVSHLDAASPASKLQRLLTESRMMIESLEKTTLPASSNTATQGNSVSNHSSPICSQNSSVQEREASEPTHEGTMLPQTKEVREILKLHPVSQEHPNFGLKSPASQFRSNPDASASHFHDSCDTQTAQQDVPQSSISPEPHTQGSRSLDFSRPYQYNEDQSRSQVVQSLRSRSHDPYFQVSRSQDFQSQELEAHDPYPLMSRSHDFQSQELRSRDPYSHMLREPHSEVTRSHDFQSQGEASQDVEGQDARSQYFQSQRSLFVSELPSMAQVEFSDTESSDILRRQVDS